MPLGRVRDKFGIVVAKHELFVFQGLSGGGVPKIIEDGEDANLTRRLLPFFVRERLAAWTMRLSERRRCPNRRKEILSARRAPRKAMATIARSLRTLRVHPGIPPIIATASSRVGAGCSSGESAIAKNCLGNLDLGPAFPIERRLRPRCKPGRSYGPAGGTRLPLYPPDRSSRSYSRKGAGRLMRTALRQESETVAYPAQRPRHSARAAVRFSLKRFRLERLRSWLKWFETEA